MAASIPKWPVVEGDYLLGAADGAVAICTLGDTDLPAELESRGLLASVAIAGPLATENLGIEHMLQNVVANPRIRFLILCGRDSRGHRAGQAILALKQNGVDAGGRIIGAAGPRPVLKNVTAEELDAFRERVAVVDAIGITDLDRLTDVIHACLSQPSVTPVWSAPRVQAPKVIMAQRQSLRDWAQDPEGFFVVLLDRNSNEIVCQHYLTDGCLNEIIRGSRAEDVANTAIHRGLLSRLDHAAYLGRELARAEMAMAHGLAYVQDEPL